MESRNKCGVIYIYLIMSILHIKPALNHAGLFYNQLIDRQLSKTKKREDGVRRVGSKRKRGVYYIYLIMNILQNEHVY